ncbi:MAG: AAA family ATPase [Endomicrobium sp.]|jgi:dCMP deaminase|nr:AAA family ATPase [Endomicrobium sp.]
MIIGLTGSYCSGKDTVAAYIVKKCGYKHYSLSDIIREIMNKKDIKPIRASMILFGTQLREEKGNGILAKKVLEKIGLNDNFCITSIRHSDEVKELKKRKKFTLINIDAPQNIRFARMKDRKRPGDPLTLEKFVEFEKKESQIEGSGQQLLKTAALSDITFVNDLNDMAALEVRIDKLLKNIENKK